MKFITIILALLISVSSFSQDDAKAKQILEKVAKQYQSYPGVSIDFVFTMENAQEDIKESSKGKAWMKGNKYKVELMGVKTYFDGTTMWSHMVDAEEVNVSTPDPNDKNTFNPSALFTEYQDGYRIRYIKEVFEHNRALHIIDLLPLRDEVKSSDFNRIKLKIDKDKNQIYEVLRFGKDGNDYIITLNKLKVEKDLKDSFFKFDKTKFPDVDIIDLRD